MRNSPPRHRAFTLIELLVVIAVIAVLIALLVPAVQKVRYTAARTQSTNNLKQLALATHAYSGAWKYLPFNGVGSANYKDNASGSWGYQVLPFVDQQPLFDSQPLDASVMVPVPTMLCAVRARPGYYSNSGSAAVTGQILQGPANAPWLVTNVVASFTASPSFTYTLPTLSGGVAYLVENVSGPVIVEFDIANLPPYSVSISNSPPGQTAAYALSGSLAGTIKITSTAASGASGDPATDFGFNVFLNDSNGGINSPNVYRQLSTITDGASNTILLGHAYVQPSVYSSTTATPPSLQPIFIAGSLATGRNTLGDTAATWLQDGAAVTANQWGSPMPEGGLMAMCDGAVRLFPYATPLTNFLLPDDGNPVELP